MLWQNYDEAIDMLEQRHQYFPQVFRWHGRRYEVDSVERSWQSATRRRHESPRRFFRVRCAEGIYELYQDLEAGTWHMGRTCRPRVPAMVLRAEAPAWR
jgi:hypothetical protein